jgi:hypothetical protein
MQRKMTVAGHDAQIQTARLNNPKVSSVIALSFRHFKGF